MKALLIIPSSLLLLSCAATESGSGLGFWVKDKPYRGTLDKNINNVNPYWQCVNSNFANILDCNKK